MGWRGLLKWSAVAVAVAMGLSAAAVQAAGPDPALVQVYNQSVPGAIDAQLKAGLPPLKIELARGLKPNEPGHFVAVPSGHVRLDLRLPGAGLARLMRVSANLVPGGAYCVFVDGNGGSLVYFEQVTRQAQVEPQLDQLCHRLVHR